MGFMDKEARDLWLRRQAVLVASHLPENPDDAAEVLRYASEVLEKFICPERRESCSITTLRPGCHPVAETGS
jgi:hypothetical protein